MPDNQKDPGDEKLLILPLGDESKKITQVISNDTARQIIELLADAPLSASDIAERLQAPLTTITYNLENLESVGLVKVEKIKYSEKGREVKIYAPVRKLIVVVPEKTDRKSVVDVLKKYLGVILAAVLASSFIEFFMRGAKVMQTSYSLDEVRVPPMPAPVPTPVRIINETMTGGEIAGIAPTPVVPVPTVDVQSIPAATATPIAPAPIVPPAPITTPAPALEYAVNATAAPVTVQPSVLDSGAVSKAAPDLFTNIANMIAAHPGLVFFLGCLFVIAIFAVVEYRKRK